jgi:acetyl coenzyme A synthetase (ADP forming)-like protein
VHIRPVRDDDEPGILAFLRGLSEESRYLRFFAGAVDLAKHAAWAADVDYRDRYGLVVTAGVEAKIVGHAVALRTGPDQAEVAFSVADDFQGYGLGTILLGQLAEAASEVGVTSFEAKVLPQNRKMIEVFRESGFPTEIRSELGEVLVEFPTSVTPEALERFERREQIAAAAAMRHFLSPGSVAVIGASRSRGTIGGELFHNLLGFEFNGPVYPVNPKAEVVQSVPAYTTILDVPGPVELAVIVVPAPLVLDAARGCGRKGVRALVVVSAGFAEVGEDGRARQRDLLRVCREFGMRLIGPNCMGIMNVAPDVRLNATFGPDVPPHGRVGFLSQSGGLGLAVIDHARSLGLGLSSFVSVGNKADISGNDLLHYWEDDSGTDVILLYLESFGNPRKFARITRRVGRTKPIIAVKSGRSAAGARATSSHTGALIAASDVTVDALFRQAGVIRTDTLSELFDVASLLANQPPPTGKRVGIMTNGGGLGILCADACEGQGLEVPPLAEEARRLLAEFLPPDASLSNPIDMIASASAEDYGRTIRIVADHGGVDAIVVIFIPPLVTRAEDVARAVREAVAGLQGRITVLSVFMSVKGVPDELRGEGVRIPSYSFPEGAASALARAVEYGTWRESAEGAVPAYDDTDPTVATSVIEAALEGGPGWLGPEEVGRLLQAYRLPLAEWRLARSPRQAALTAREMGGPVALKAVAAGLLHKTEAGAVKLGISGPTAVQRAAEQMRERVRGQGMDVAGYLVQRMVPSGVEMLVGVVHDAVFGPVVACGAGGTAVELLKDVSVRITHPLRTATRPRWSARSRPSRCWRDTGERRRPTCPRWRRSCCESAPWSRPIPRSSRWTSTP